jgi:hypothetical protein
MAYFINRQLSVYVDGHYEFQAIFKSIQSTLLNEGFFTKYLLRKSY